MLKVQPNLRYATDGRSAAAFALACRQAGVPLQRYEHRADLPCGSTIGPMTSARTGIPTVDVGAPQLAMHSARELMGADDVSRVFGRTGCVSVSAVTSYSAAMTLRMEMVTFDCTEPAAVAGWWAEQFGGQTAELMPGEFVVVTRSDGPRLGFQRVADPTPGKNRVHLDFATADVDGEVSRLCRGRRDGGRSAPDR